MFACCQARGLYATGCNLVILAYWPYLYTYCILLHIMLVCKIIVWRQHLWKAFLTFFFAFQRFSSTHACNWLIQCPLQGPADEFSRAKSFLNTVRGLILPKYWAWQGWPDENQHDLQVRPPHELYNSSIIILLVFYIYDCRHVAAGWHPARTFGCWISLFKSGFKLRKTPDRTAETQASLKLGDTSANLDEKYIFSIQLVAKIDEK